MFIVFLLLCMFCSVYSVSLCCSVYCLCECVLYYCHRVSTQLQLTKYIIQSNPITGLDRPGGFQEVEAPRFQDSRHMKVVRLSAVRTGRLYPLGNIPGTHIC